MKKIVFALGILASFLWAKDTVTVSILPQKYFVKQIAGDTLNVNVMVQKGDDPHTYEPKPDQMVNLEKSKIYFTSGIDYENTWLPKFKATYPHLIIVDTNKGITLQKMAEHHHDHEADEHEMDHNHMDMDHDHDADHEAHEHEHEHHHHHHGLDPHVWLDPVLVKTIAHNIEVALVKEFPQHKALYEKNLAIFDKKLDKLNTSISKELKNVKNRVFVVYHPSWGYYAKRYGLTQVAIELEGKDPKPAQLAELIDEAKEHGAKIIFVAPQFSKKAAMQVAEATGARVVEVDHLSQDWYNEMVKMTNYIAGK